MKMHCLILLFSFSTLFLCIDSSEIYRDIIDYFNSGSVGKFRKQWDNVRKPLENAIATALRETMGTAGMNVYIRMKKDLLAEGYYHSDNQVSLVLKDLDLKELPRAVMPEVSFSLASNVLKVQTSLSEMIIDAEYSVMRNASDILYDPEEQNPNKSSPFLFQQTKDYGNVAISVEGCFLTGFIISTLSGESVNLRYGNLKLENCRSTVVIYRYGEESPPVIAKYVVMRDDGEGLGISHLLLKTLSEELIPKLQSSVFTIVNTSSVFGDQLREFRVKQEMLFRSVSEHLRAVVRELNRLKEEKNNGSVVLKNHYLQWDDIHKQKTWVKLSEMVLTGLDTTYLSHSGGPYKMNVAMIAEELRYSSLQVHGLLEVSSKTTDKYKFHAEIRDMMVEIILDVEPGKGRSRRSDGDSWGDDAKHGYKEIEVTGFRRMTVVMPSVIYGPVESLITGYLLREMPKAIKAHVKAILPDALKASPDRKEYNEEDEETEIEVTTKGAKCKDKEDSQADYDESKEITDMEKLKKRFMSANGPRRSNRKREADNQIRKE